jgi:hypothetical protein
VFDTQKNFLHSCPSLNYNSSLFVGIQHLEKFVILDKKNPYQIVNGTVMNVFTNPEDGDHHVHILVDEKYRDLIKVKLFYLHTLSCWE